MPVRACRLEEPEIYYAPPQLQHHHHQPSHNMPDQQDQDKNQPQLRAQAHERIDHAFTHPLFDYNTPIKYQRMLWRSYWHRHPVLFIC